MIFTCAKRDRKQGKKWLLKLEEKSALIDSFPHLFIATETLAALSAIAIGPMDGNQNRLVGLLTGKKDGRQ